MRSKILIALALLAVSGVAWSDSMRLQLIARSEQVASTAIDSLIRVTGDTADRFRQLASGQMEWGSGSAAPDTNLYRSAADTLKTDDSMTVGATLSAVAGTFTGDVTGDGGDQFFGFLQDQVASTTVAITAAQTGKTFVSNSADVMTLPEASTVLGARYTFVCGTADDFDINPADATDVIGTVASITGTNTTTVLAPAAGDAIRCTDIGSSITLEAVGADLWASVGNANGIWTDVN